MKLSYKDIRIWAALALATFAGCKAPSRAQSVGEGKLIKRTSRSQSPRPRAWHPVTGRLEKSVLSRHAPPGGGWKTLFSEAFDAADAPHWRRFGAPVLETIRLEGAAGLEVRPPDRSFDLCGIQRDLNPDLLAGRDVCLEMEFACRSLIDVEALDGVRISFQVDQGIGQPVTLSLPLEADISPGWETHSFWLRFLPTLRRATLRIDIVRPAGSIRLNEIRIVGMDGSRGSPPPPPRSDFGPPGPACREPDRGRRLRDRWAVFLRQCRAPLAQWRRVVHATGVGVR